MRSNRLKYILFLLFVAISQMGYGQKKATPPAKAPTVQAAAPYVAPDQATIAAYKERIKQLISSLEYTMNLLGDDATAQDEKMTVLTSSYLKFFKDNNVQVEDDLDENRQVSIKKPAQSYLQDIDYFYKKVKFALDIDDISFFDEATRPYFKVTITRNLRGITFNNDSVNNTKQRFIEINLDAKEQDLRIASIYSTSIDEAADLRSWWRNLPLEWVQVFMEQAAIQANASDEQLKTLVNKEELTIAGNKAITGLEPLYKFTQLKKLNIAFTKVSDLSPLRSLAKLQYLNADSTLIVNLQALKYAVNLSELSIANTGVTDLSQLLQFHLLKKLNIQGLPFKSLAPLSSLKGLEELNMSHTQPDDFSSISALENLVRLDLSYSTITDLKLLAKFNKLSYLAIEGTKVSDLQPLSDLKALKTLVCNKTFIATLQPLKDLPILQSIYCDETPVTQEEASAFMLAHPQTQVINRTELLRKWWNELSIEWKSLFRKYISFEGIPSKEQLAAIIRINKVDIGGKTGFIDLIPLEQLANLEILNCSNTGVTDLEPLTKCTQLQQLNFAGNSVNSLKPLSALPKLKAINCNNTLVDSAQMSRFIDEHPRCVILYQSAKLAAYWGALPPAWKRALSTQFHFTETPNEVALHWMVRADSIVVQNEMLDQLQPLLWFTHLRKLRLINTQIGDLQPLTQLNKLEILQINQSPIKDLITISGINSLKILDIRSTGIEKLDALAALPQLEELNCSGTPVESLKPLAALQHLRVLDCSNTQVSSLRHLKELGNLQLLICYNTGLSKRDIAKFKEIQTNCKVVHY